MTTTRRSASVMPGRVGSSSVSQVVLVNLAVAIVLGATSMRQIALLAHQAEVLGDPPSDSTVRRTLEQAADPRVLARLARARAKVRARVWGLIEATTAGFPWIAVAAKVLTGWVVIDIDATLITAHSAKQGAVHRRLDDTTSTRTPSPPCPPARGRPPWPRTGR